MKPTKKLTKRQREERCWEKIGIHPVDFALRHLRGFLPERPAVLDTGGLRRSPSAMDSHYMYRPPVLDREEFLSFVADVRKLIAAMPESVGIHGRDGDGDPEIGPNLVAFNGDRSRGEEHEPLVIEQMFTIHPPSRMRDGVHFDFCKTVGKPYERLVVAVLYALIYHFPQVKFTSDLKQDRLRDGFDLFVNAVRPIGDVEALRQKPIRDRLAAH